MSTIEDVRNLLGRTLQLGDRANGFTEDTLLLGNLPELDSMAVATLVAAIEEHFGIVIYDDEISADTFESLGSLARFVAEKTAA